LLFLTIYDFPRLAEDVTKADFQKAIDDGSVEQCVHAITPQS
jgi:hypothetical protein